LSEFLAFLITGLVAGSVYSLYASGLVLIYSASGIYNLAFGAFAFIAGLTFYELGSVYMPRGVAFVLSVFVLAPLAGLVFERVIFRRLARVPEVARLMGTIGLLVGLPALAFKIIQVLKDDVGLGLASVKAVYAVPGIGPTPPKIFRLFGGSGSVSSDQLIVLGATVVAVAALWVLLTKTRIGLMTRAVVDRAELASTRGISASFTSRVAWSLGSMFAALAGILGGPLYGLSTVVALQFVVAASAVAVLARFRSLPIAVVGGLVVGAASNLFNAYSGKVSSVKKVFDTVPGLRSSFIYIVLVGALLWRGAQRARVAGVTRVSEPVPMNWLSDLPRWRRSWPWVAMFAALLVWGTRIIPWGHVQAGGLEQSLIKQSLAMSLVFLSFVVVVGMLGVASLAQAAFVTAGALMAGMIASNGYLGGSLPVAVLLGGITAAVLGMIVAVPALRLGGLALALTTLALGFIADQILFDIDRFSNYGLGWRLVRPKWGPVDLADDRWFIVLLFLILMGCLWLVGNVQRSPIGRAIIAVRFGAAGAAASGISAARATLVAFGVSGLLAGLAGALLAYGSNGVTPTTWPTEIGLLWLTIAVLQGVRRPAAALMGGMISAFFGRLLQEGFFGLVPEIDDPTIPVILFGMSAVLLANQPDGMLHQTSMQNRMRRDKWRAKHAPVVDASPADADATAVADPAVPQVVSSIPRDDIALELIGVSARYVETTVLHHIDLVVPRGAVVAVLGPNGAGKSTLCGAIAGTVEVTEGRIEVNGQAIGHLPAHRRLAAGVMLAPESRGIFPGLTVEENLEVLLPDREVRERAMHRFPQLANRRKIVAANLSGGEQQMLCLAPILAEPPKILLADEITLGLAPTIAAEIRSVLRELRDDGVSIVLVDEKAKNVLEFADYVVLLSLGRVRFAGPASELTEDLAMASYIGSASTEGAVR
jgi:ABC-type branched-subunit amino acid transport system ATPase component/branched-subunit amino acid ABC-type transport system permease component